MGYAHKNLFCEPAQLPNSHPTWSLPPNLAPACPPRPCHLLSLHTVLSPTLLGPQWLNQAALCLDPEKLLCLYSLQECNLLGGKWKYQLLSGVQLFATLWTVARKAGISQTRILEWVTISFSRGFSWSRDGTWVSCITGGFLPPEPRGKPCNLPERTLKSLLRTSLRVSRK